MGETTGGAIIAQMLRAEGIEKFFGIVDGTYTQLFAHCVELGMEMLSPRHESVAAHVFEETQYPVCIGPCGGAPLRVEGQLGEVLRLHAQPHLALACGRAGPDSHGGPRTVPGLAGGTWCVEGGRCGGMRPNQRLQLTGAKRPGLRPVLLAGGDQRNVEFASADISPAAEPQGR